MALNRVIQFQNGQEFDEFIVNEHPRNAQLELAPTVTVQLFTSEHLPVGYLILDAATAIDLGNELIDAGCSPRGQSDEQ